MANNSIREALAAALPARAAANTPASGLSFDGIASRSTTASTENTGGGESFNGVAQILGSTLQDASDSVTQANKQLAELQAIQQAMLASTAQNTQALNANTSAKGGGSAAASTVGNVIAGIMGQGSILTPIIGGLMSLFGHGEAAPQPVFSTSTLPAPVQVETSLARSSMPDAPAAPVPRSTAGQSAAGGSPQIQIQVQAIDSRSFLDHSSEIAEAVRHALLNSHSLGDVIAEL